MGGNSIQSILLPETERVYREGRDGGGGPSKVAGGVSSQQGGPGAAIMRLDMVKNIRKVQQEIEIAHEAEFHQSKAEHEGKDKMIDILSKI